MGTVVNPVIHLPYEAAYGHLHIFPGKVLHWFNSKMVGEIITSMKLTPMRIQAIPMEEKTAGPKVTLELINGGMKALHLHYENQIYLVNEKQWAEISTRIVADVKAKLTDVHQVGFEEGVMLASMFEH